MNELTLLREFRSDAPGPTAAETTDARDRLLTAIADGRAASGTAAAQPRRAVPGGRPHRRFRALAAAAAAVAAVGVAVATIVASGPRATQPRSAPEAATAAFVLRQAASAAAGRPAGHGRFFVTESEYITPSNRQDDPAMRTIWIGNGVTGRLIQGRHGQAAIPPAIPFGRRTITWGQLQNLPTAPGPLLADIAKVSRNIGQPLADAEFGTAVALLFEYPSPPALRSALYNLAARLPGVTLVPGARDLIGRTAAEVYLPPGFPGNDGQALFFDPSTSAVLGVAYLVGSRLQCPPAWEDAVLAVGYVSSKHQLPPGAPQTVRPVTRPTSVPGCPSPTSGRPTPSPAAGQPVPTPSTSPGQ